MPYRIAGIAHDTAVERGNRKPVEACPRIGRGLQSYFSRVRRAMLSTVKASAAKRQF
jgi:hypothetical protein